MCTRDARIERKQSRRAEFTAALPTNGMCAPASAASLLSSLFSASRREKESLKSCSAGHGLTSPSCSLLLVLAVTLSLLATSLTAVLTAQAATLVFSSRSSTLDFDFVL